MFPENENYDSMTQWDGSTYMTPTDTGPLVIYYNKDIFDEKGVNYPSAGWTWDEFRSTVEILSYTRNDGTQVYGWGQAAGWNGSYGRCANFMRRNGHVEWDTIVEPTEARWDHPEVISGLQFVVYDTIANSWSPRTRCDRRRRRRCGYGARGHGPGRPMVHAPAVWRIGYH